MFRRVCISTRQSEYCFSLCLVTFQVKVRSMTSKLMYCTVRALLPMSSCMILIKGRTRRWNLPLSCISGRAGTTITRMTMPHLPAFPPAGTAMDQGRVKGPRLEVDKPQHGQPLHRQHGLLHQTTPLPLLVPVLVPARMVIQTHLNLFLE